MRRTMLAALAALAIPLAASAATDTEKLLADAHQAASNSLAIVKCTYVDETGEHPVAGLAVCYDAENGEFMTIALDVQMKPDRIRDLRLELPGVDHKTIPAELLGIRPEVGLSFIKATEKHPWQAVRFAESSNLKMGQAVASAGLVPGEPSNAPYVGLAYVAAERRAPERIYAVTGGALTSTGSPVFAADGLAVGMVARPAFREYQIATQQGTDTVRLANTQESSFFLPVEEFAYALQRIPRGGSVPRLPWLGVLKVTPVGPEQAGILKLDRPAAMIDEVVPGGEGEKAGLKNGDIVVGVDGQPLEKLATPELTVRNMMQKMSRTAGKSIELTMLREGQEVKVSVPLTDMPTLPEEAPRYISPELALMLRERVPLDKYMDKSPARDVEGMQVVGVGNGGPAHTAGLAVNDIVTAINGQPVKTAAVTSQIIDASLKDKPMDPVVMLIRREGKEPQAISIIPPRPQE